MSETATLQAPAGKTRTLDLDELVAFGENPAQDLPPFVRETLRTGGSVHIKGWRGGLMTKQTAKKILPEDIVAGAGFDTETHVLYRLTSSEGTRSHFYTQGSKYIGYAEVDLGDEWTP